MIERYWTKRMREIWQGDVRKFEYWLKVEIAVLEAREELGQIPYGTAKRVKERTWVDDNVAWAIEEREKTTRHDLNAFVDIMRLQILMGKNTLESTLINYVPEIFDFNLEVTKGLASLGDNPDTHYFHDGMTSYDTEEPAMSLLIRDSAGVIVDDMGKLLTALESRALKHKGQLMIGRTHGQHAQPITFGIKCLNWRDQVLRAEKRLLEAVSSAMVMKLSGAVGVYGTLGPDIEKLVGKKLALSPVIATQILALDYRAAIVNEVALAAAIVEKIASDLWLMSQTEIGEIREPFGKLQKGSSAMPHKKNPITLEKIKGCAALVRGYAHSLLEQVATAHERDISHSSVERMALADAFGIFDHMLTELTRIVNGMEVFPDRMLQNLNLTRGAIASQKIEMVLKKYGMPAEEAYRIVQEVCSELQKGEYDLFTLLYQRTVMWKWGPVAPPLTMNDELHAALDWKTWVQHEDFLYKRAGNGG